LRCLNCFHVADGKKRCQNLFHAPNLPMKSARSSAG
jgi:hypothetical protein